jgi:hypothetical protein
MAIEYSVGDRMFILCQVLEESIDYFEIKLSKNDVIVTELAIMTLLATFNG